MRSSLPEPEDRPEYVLLVFALARERAPLAAWGVWQDLQAQLAARGLVRATASFDVSPTPSQRWIDGGVDVVGLATEADLIGSVSRVARARPGRRASSPVSVRAFAARSVVVKRGPATGLHVFAIGGMATGFTRSS